MTSSVFQKRFYIYLKKTPNLRKKNLKKMSDLVMKIVIAVDEYEQLKLASSKLAES